MSVIIVGPNVNAFTLQQSGLGGTDELGGYPTVTIAIEVTVTESQTATVTKIVNYARTISVTETQTPTITDVASHPRTITVTESQTATEADTFIPAGGGTTTPETISVTQTQDATVLYAVVVAPPRSSGGGIPKKARKPEKWAGTFTAYEHQSVTVDVQLEPLGLPLIEDDELALLLLI